jgi:hypothetical protein
MFKKQAEYQERIVKLRRQAQDGNIKAMEELYRRYHINQMMIDGELVNLKQRFVESPSGF